MLWLLGDLIVVGSLGEWISCFSKIDSNTKQTFFLGLELIKVFRLSKLF